VALDGSNCWTVSVLREIRGTGKKGKEEVNRSWTPK
jgi:hypothetical protein